MRTCNAKGGVCWVGTAWNDQDRFPALRFRESVPGGSPIEILLAWPHRLADVDPYDLDALHGAAEAWFGDGTPPGRVLGLMSFDIGGLHWFDIDEANGVVTWVERVVGPPSPRLSVDDTAVAMSLWTLGSATLGPAWREWARELVGMVEEKRRARGTA